MLCQAENVLPENKTLDSLLVERYLAGDSALALSRQYGIEMLLLKDRLKALMEPMGRRLRFEPLPGPQTEFMNDMRHRYVGFKAGWRSGKSVCGAQKLSEMHVWNAGFLPGQPFTPTNVKSLIVAQTYQMIQRVNLPQIIDAFERIGLRTEPISDPKRSMIVIPELGTKRSPSEIYLCSAESPEKICGFEVGWVWCDEASRYAWSEDNPLNDAVVQADSRLSDARAKVRQMTFTFTPEGTATRMFRDFEMGWWDDNGFRRLGKHGHILYRARTSDNPHVGDYVQHQRRQLSPDQYKQFIDGETMENNSGRVFSSFSDDPVNGNVDDTISIDPHVPLEIGVDFNVTMHCVLGQSFTNPRLVTSVYELSEKNMTIPQMVTALANLCENVIGWKWSTALPLHVYGDPAGHARAGGRGESQWDVLMSYLRAQSIPFSLRCGRSHAAVSERVAHANAALKNAEGEIRWKIHSRCIGLLKDLKFLSWTGDGSIDKRDNERSHFAEGDTNRIFQLVPISKVSVPAAGRIFTV